MIPKLELLMGRLQRAHVALRDGLEAAAAARGCTLEALDLEPLLREDPTLREAAQRIQRLVEEIEETGGQFKGLELGLVDFPAEVDGQPGLLCWQYGEKEITHWHTEDGGFAGRQPLPRVKAERYLQ